MDASNFFELRSPRDMLNKARREHQRLSENFNIDNLFNFFVTAYHIKEYILKSDSLSQKDIEEFLKHEEMEDCRDICNKGKHLKLTHCPDVKTLAKRVGYGEMYGLAYGGGDVWVLYSGARIVNVRALARKVLIRWEDFFAEKNL